MDKGPGKDKYIWLCYLCIKWHGERERGKKREKGSRWRGVIVNDI